jgi:aspartate 1-decarboxylase
MLKTFIGSKIHRARVTAADLNYMGSISIGPEMMEAAGIKEYELVHVNNLSNAAHWETYVIIGKSGEIKLNGAPSRLFTVGDLVVIMSLVHLEPDETYQHVTVLVDDANNVTKKILGNIKND